MTPACIIRNKNTTASYYHSIIKLP